MAKHDKKPPKREHEVTFEISLCVQAQVAHQVGSVSFLHPSGGHALCLVYHKKR